MNRIRFRQFLQRADNSFDKCYWGLVEGKFVPPIKRIDGTYPESFQSTGLHDSKGVEVWDGSVIVPCLSHPVNYVVKQDPDGQWMLKGEDGWHYHDDSLNSFLEEHPDALVIGNTTENHSLIGG